VKLEGPTFNEYVIGAVPVTLAVSKSNVAVEIPGLLTKNGAGGAVGAVPPPPAAKPLTVETKFVQFTPPIVSTNSCGVDVLMPAVIVVNVEGDTTAWPFTDDT